MADTAHGLSCTNHSGTAVELDNRPSGSALAQKTAFPDARQHSKGVMIEISDAAVKKAEFRAADLARKDKTLIVMHGDVTARLDDALALLEQWCQCYRLTGLVCSAQAVLHELPFRSSGFDLSVFLGKLFRSSDWTSGGFYSREPCSPVGWPSDVRVRISDLPAKDFARAATFVRDRLKMSGTPQILASNWAALPSLIALETLHKLIRGNSIRRIGYELGEQLTSFDPMAVKRHLESYLPDMHVAVEYVTTSGFKKALQDYDVEYLGQDSSGLPLPRTHSEIIGIWPSRMRASLDKSSATCRIKEQERASLSPRTMILEAVLSTNPFKGDVSDEQITTWLEQFDEPDRPVITRLLSAFTYVTLNDMRNLTQKLHADIVANLGSAASRALFVPLGGVAKSGGLVSYFYRRENSLPAEQFTDYSGLAQTPAASYTAVVLLDDLLASGHQAVAEWQRIEATTRHLTHKQILLKII